MKISPKVTSDEVVGFFTIERSQTTIILDYIDLQVEGVYHNRALYLIISLAHKYIPIILVENRFSVNMCPLKTTKELGLTTDGMVSPRPQRPIQYTLHNLRNSRP